MAYSSGYLPIYTQGVFLGSGKITQMSFEGGTDVRYKPFSIGFEILKSGDLSAVTGELYTGISQIYNFLPFFNGFSETCEYSQTNNLTTDFTRNISFGFEKGYMNQITGAHMASVKILSCLTELGVYSPLPPPQYSGVEGMLNSVYQTIDTINGNFSYSEAYSYQSGLPWIHEYQNSLQYDEGVTTVSEQGTIKATQRFSGYGDRIAYANSGWSVIEPQIYPRVYNVFDRWYDQFQYATGCLLDSEPAQKNLTKDYARGLISYDYSYNNDAASNSGFYNSYEQSLTLNNDGWIDVQVNGELRARQTSPSGALDYLTLQYTGSIRPQISGYAEIAYSNSENYFKSPFCSTGYLGVLALLNTEETYGDLPARISYGYSFTDDPSYITTGIFRRIKNRISNQEVTPLVNTFRIVNYLELPQNSYQSNLGVLSNSIEIIGTTGAALSQYKSAASGRLVVPTGIYWMISNTYEYSPLENRFAMNVAYNYEGYRAINDYNL